MDLLTNATMVDDAIRFVSSKFKEKSPDNINEKDQESEHETRKITTSINQI